MEISEIARKITVWILESIPQSVLFYILWIFVHFISAHLYVHWCAGNSFIGFLMSPIYSSAPHCQALSWMVYTLSKEFIVMWIALGTFICGKMFLNKKKE